VWDGYSHGSTWNGFDNVAVTQDDRIIRWVCENSIHKEEVDESGFKEIKPMENGLYSLGWGYSTQIVS
jgi:hypothetical protein